MQHSLAPDDALRSEAVGDAWEEHPTWALLRSYNGRWILPLFSQHLEHADGPVSADWFHHRVAEALGQAPPEQMPPEQMPEQEQSEQPPSHDEQAADAEEQKTGPAGYCRMWVENRWLIRTRSAGPDGRAHYRLSQYALKALRIVRELIEQDNAVSEARLGSITHAVRQLTDMADPSAASQIARIDEEIAELRLRRAAIEAGETEPVSGEVMKRQLREVIRLTSSLPEDFRQLSSMVEQRHREVARRASFEHLGKGAFVEQYLRENDLLEQTPEGRAYRGFANMLSSREVDAMRANIEQLLAQPFASEHLAAGQRAQLESLISSLLVEEQSVQETYGRWTSSLRRFLSRSSVEKHQHLLTLAERALHAGALWTQQRPGQAGLPEDILGLGTLNVNDISQAQLWRDRGRPTVEVRISANDQPLPETDRASLRLAAGTSPAAIDATVERLLATQETVTSADVYEATDEEFRRLGLVLSMLDRAVEHGIVATETEAVRITTDNGTVREVRLPRLVFERRTGGRGDPGAETNTVESHDAPPTDAPPHDGEPQGAPE